MRLDVLVVLGLVGGLLAGQRVPPAVGLDVVALGLVRGLLAFGLGFGLLVLLSVASPRLFGLFDVPLNLAGNVLHTGVAVISITVALLARGAERRELSAG